MGKKSIYGLRREQLHHVLSAVTDLTKSWDALWGDCAVATRLETWLDTPFREVNMASASLGEALQKSGYDTDSPGNKSLSEALSDPNTDAALLQSINNCARRLSMSANNEADHAVAFTIYYAAIASSIVFHERKIGTHSYESLIESFTDLTEKKWISPKLKELFSNARETCQKKLSVTEEGEEPDVGRTASTIILGERIGSRISRYRLLSILGEGGMGIVYLAEQEQPIRRRVALKVIKPGMDSARIIARFEAERQALALLDHASIAKVFDAGTGENGRPYFVMEYVEGLSITEHCDRNKLTIEDRLSLFLQVCHAVQYAHRKGIIHRDIKPSNILVAVNGDQVIPKVIDFGVARAISQPLTERTSYTEQGQLLGTPEYMSPEQAEMTHEDIDTRSDVYSLGVLLYVLLTGVLPFDPKKLREGGTDYIRQTIRDVEPKTPSRRLSSLGEEAEKVAQNRRTGVGTLAKRLHKELEWIPLKAMQKERERRYQSASEFAADIENYLNGAALIAAPPGAVYRLKKYVRRHRAQMAVGGTVLCAAILAIVLSVMYFRAEGQRGRVQKEISAREEAAVLSHAEVFHIRGQYNEALTHLESISDSETIGSAARLLRARLLNEMGQVDEAETLLKGLLNEPHDISGAAHFLLARIYLDNDPTKAQEHQSYAESMLAETADACYFRAITMSTPEEATKWLIQGLELDPGHYPSRKALALVYYTLGDFVRMRQNVEAVLALRPKDSLGYALRAIAECDEGRLDNALADYERAIELCTNEAELAELHDQRREVYMRIGDYRAALADARRCEELAPNQIDQFINGFNVFTAMVALEHYEEAKGQHRKFIGADSTMQQDFEDWAKRYVFDMLAMGRPFDLPTDIASEEAFSAMQEAADFYQRLAIKSTRVVPRAYGQASWSPDARQLAYGRRSNRPWGRQRPKVLRAAGPAIAGPYGIEILDMATGATRLLVGFGRDPVWSPDGRYIAFVRDWDERIREFKEELWLVPASGSKPRRMAEGTSPSWSHDGTKLFFYSPTDATLYSLRVDDSEATPVPMIFCPGEHPVVSPDEQNIAYTAGDIVRILNLSSGEIITQWYAPVPHEKMWMAWSPDSQELSVGGTRRLGVWILDVSTQEARHVFDGPARSANWSIDGSRMSIRIGAGYDQIWCAVLDSGCPTHEALAPAQTREEFLLGRRARCIHHIASSSRNVGEWTRELTWIAREQYRMGAYEEALETLLSREELLPNGMIDEETSARILIFKAMNLYQLGRNKEAKATLEQAHGWLGRSIDACAGFSFGIPTCLGPAVNSAHNEWTSRISMDGLSLIFGSDRPGGAGSHDLWITTRDHVENDWTPAVNLGPPVNTAAYECGPCLTPNGLALYFCDGSWFRKEPARPGSHGNGDIWITTRTSTEAQWTPPENLGPEINSPDYDGEPFLSADGLTLYFDSERPGGRGGVDLWRVTRPTIDSKWDQPENLGPTVNSSYTDWSPSVSTDGRMLFFMSNRPGSRYGPDDYDLWVTTRPTTTDEWRPPENLGPTVNSSAIDAGPSIAGDGSTLFFHSTRPSGTDLGLVNIWQVGLARITEVPSEMNRDKIDDGLIGHWMLNETEGAFAHDATGDKNGTLIGNPIWRPTNGTSSGSLELDGIDDCVIVPSVLNPADGAFSILIRVMTNTPGGVIISQSDGSWWGSDWLVVAPSTGTLLTRLADSCSPLESEAVITDGRWHDVGLVWDGARRYLYIDGVNVAADTSGLTVVPCDGELHLGVGKDLDIATSWCGQMDDLSIYGRSLSPGDIVDFYRNTSTHTRIYK